MSQRYAPPSAEALAEPDDHLVFQRLSEHLQQLLGDEWHPITNIEQLQGVPQWVKNVWYLWWFAAEVAGNGFVGWLGNLSVSCAEIEATRCALRAVNAEELAELLDAGIPLSKEYGAEFWEDPASNEFSNLMRNPKWRDLADLDEHSFDLTATPLSSLVASYARAQ